MKHTHVRYAINIPCYQARPLFAPVLFHLDMTDGYIDSIIIVMVDGSN